MFKNLLTVGALCSALLATTSARAQAAYDQFPLEDGNLWVYMTDSEGYLVGDTGTRTVEVTEERYLGRGWYANRLAGLFAPHSSVLMYDNAWSAGIWARDGFRWSTVFRFAAAIGHAWSFRAGPCDAFDVERYDTAGATVTVPAGDFADTRGFLFTQTPDPTVRCMGPSLRSLITAPGLGPIAFSTDQHKGHLVYARVDGAVVASAPHSVRTLDGIETTLLVAQDRLVHQPVVCVTEPCDPLAAQLNVVFVLRNVSEQAIALNFDSSQAFELDLWVGDDLVRRYSDEQLFAQAIWGETLAPGEARVFSGHLPLSRSRDGAPLIGEVQVVGYMTTRDPAGKLAVGVEGVVE